VRRLGDLVRQRRDLLDEQRARALALGILASRLLAGELERPLPGVGVLGARGGQIGQRLLGERALEQCRELLGGLGVLRAGLDGALLEPVLRAEVAVVDVQVLRGHARDGLRALVEAARDLRGAQGALGELIGALLQLAHGRAPDQGDHGEADDERAERDAEAHGESEVVESG
jgi:hypothetical protein